MSDGSDDAEGGAGGDGNQGGTPTTGGVTASGGSGGAGATGGDSGGAGTEEGGTAGVGGEPAGGGAGGAEGGAGGASGKVCMSPATGEASAMGKNCADYCGAYLITCAAFNSTDQTFADEAECLMRCEFFDDVQLCCRAYHVEAAATNATLHCPHAAGNSPCN